MPNTISEIAKVAAAKIRTVADTVEAYAEAAIKAQRPMNPESFAAEILERLAAELRSRKRR